MKIREEIGKFTKSVNELANLARDIKETQEVLDSKIKLFGNKVVEFSNISKGLASDINAIVRRQIGD